MKPPPPREKAEVPVRVKVEWAPVRTCPRWFPLNRSTWKHLLGSHVKRTHSSDHLGGVRPRRDLGRVRRGVERHVRLQPWHSEQRSPTTEHVLWGDGSDHPVHVQHHTLPEDR